MSAGVTINDVEINRKIAEWAVVCNKDMEQATRDVATRFVKAAVRNTPPMMTKTSPAQAKRDWTARVEANYAKKPFVLGKWLSKPEMRRVLQAKKKQLGREAAGWNAAARELKTSVPAWVKRHSAGEGHITICKDGESCTITVANSVPYSQDFLRRRAEFALNMVKHGLNASLRVLKKRILRSMR